MAPMDPLIGLQLGNFRIERVLGRGGMAVVYYAVDVQLGRPAAVKVIDARFRDDPTYAKRFLKEARTVAAWRHENILQVYYADVQDDLYFFAMEFIDGRNLAEVLADYSQKGETPPQALALSYGKAIASALDYAHAQGVIHRDLKPSNVLVTDDGRVVLGDFGLALNVQQGSLGEAFGSAHYMAPEQARSSKEAVPQSDLYSLGVMLYKMLTGVVPFDDPSPASLALQHIAMPPPPPRQVNPKLNEATEAVLLKALAKEPEERYASGADMMAALEEALALGLRDTDQPGRPAQISPEEVSTASFQAVHAINDGKSRRWGPLTILTSATGCGLLGLVIILTLAVLAWRGGLANPTMTQEPRAFFPQSTLTTSPSPAETGLTPNPPTPTNTPAADTPTLTPSAKPPSQTPTLTASPSSTPTPPPSSTPTPSPSSTPTPSPRPSKTATRTLTPTWTPRYASGRHMILFWNESSFYMLQVSGKSDLVHPLTFERLDSNGLVSDRFSANIWGELHPSTRSNWCMRLEIGGPSSEHLHPKQCQDKYLATHWPNPGDGTIFWTSQEGSPYFRVLWRQEEIQRCEITSGLCEMYIP